MVATSRPWLSAYGSSVISIEKPKGLRRFAYRSFDLVADFKRLFGELRHLGIREGRVNGFCQSGIG